MVYRGQPVVCMTGTRYDMDLAHATPCCGGASAGAAAAALRGTGDSSSSHRIVHADRVSGV
jgi:hypothetical protein